nr:hypothetical protein [Tanacetum cinerariifolium]
AKEVSGWVPDFDEDEEEEDDSMSDDEVRNTNVDKKKSEDSLQYPPGFTPVIPDAHNVSPSDREGEKYSFHGQEDKVDSDA